MIKLTLEVELESPLHIGAETRRNTDASRAFLKDVDGYPYIPASSIKGRLRHETEALLKSLSYPVCNSPNPASMCRHLDPDNFCVVCQLFGSPWLESRLTLDDLHLIPGDMTDESKVPRTETRVSVSINRKRRAQQPKRLFDTELFAPGIPLCFRGEGVFRSSDLSRLAPIVLATHAITELGSGRTRGFGWCSLRLHTDPPVGDLAALWEIWRAQNEI